MSHNPDDTKYWWQAKCKDMMVKKRCYTSSLSKMFPTVLGFCDKDLRGKVRNRVSFNYLEYVSDNLGMLNTTK